MAQFLLLNTLVLSFLFPHFEAFAAANPNTTECSSHLEKLAKSPEQAFDFSRSSDVQITRSIKPKTEAELQNIVKRTNLPISIVGGGFSMGGQTIAKQGLRIDMSDLNKVTAYNPAEKTVTVQAGITWAELQKVINKDGLAIKVMQTYNNFSVGGSLSVNVHGRYVGFGPIISTVRSIRLLMADGNIVTASRTENPELFAGAVGGYGGLGIILDATLDLAPNQKLERTVVRHKGTIEQIADSYLRNLEKNVLADPNSVMTNTDIFPNSNTAYSITFKATDKPLTVLDEFRERSTSTSAMGWMKRMLYRLAISTEQLTRSMKLFRERFYVPHDLRDEQVVMRNWEASYDVTELLPTNDRLPWLKKILPFSNRKALLQEYFVPKEQLAGFLEEMVAIYREHNVNYSNISLRHVPANSEAMLSWSNQEAVAVVVYYTQPYGIIGTKKSKLEKAQEWTQKVLDKLLARGGTYYLPYQTYATNEQFENAYPRSEEFFALKAKADPTGRFTNNLLDKYGPQQPNQHYAGAVATDQKQMQLYKFFKNIFTIFEPKRYLDLIKDIVASLRRNGAEPNDLDVYKEIQNRISEIKPKGPGFLTSQIASLREQQAEMVKETEETLTRLGITEVNGYMEIGTLARYINPLKRKIKITGEKVVVHDKKPGFDPVSLLERTGGYGILDPRSFLPIVDFIPLLARTKFVDIRNYDQITQANVPNNSMELATMYAGLHHAPDEKLRLFVASIFRSLKPGGVFILRDHDYTEDNAHVVHLAHSAYNAALGVDFDEEAFEIRNFQPLSFWRNLLKEAGFEDTGIELYQANDPTRNALITFRKPLSAGDPLEMAAQLRPTNHADFMKSVAGISEYHRPDSNTVMTLPEWYFVDVFEEFANFMKHSPWYLFPFDEFIEQTEQIYRHSIEFALRKGVIDQKAFEAYDQMDSGLVMCVKVLFTGMGTAAKLIKHGLRNESVHGKTYYSTEISPDMQKALPKEFIEKFKDLGNNIFVTSSDRYLPFTEEMFELAKHGLSPMEVAGHNTIAVVLTSESETLPTIPGVDLDLIYSYRFPSAVHPLASGISQAYYYLVQIPVNQVANLINNAATAGLKPVRYRFHDY